MKHGKNDRTRPRGPRVDAGEPPRARTAAASKRDAFLVLDPDPLSAAAIASALSPCGKVTIVRRAEDALRAKPAHGRWTALFLAVELPKGDGLAVLEALRTRGEHAPAVMISENLNVGIVSRTFEVGAALLAKPMEERQATLFLDRMGSSGILNTVVENWRGRYDLTESEVGILRDVLEGVDRSGLAARRGITADTLKTHVRHLLRKTDSVSLAGVARRAFGELISYKSTKSHP